VHCGTDIVDGNTDNSSPLQRQLGLCRSASRPRHHPRLRCPQARGDRCAPRRAATGPPASRCGRKPAKRRRLHRVPPRHLRSRSQDRLGRRQALSSYTVQLLSNKTPCSIEQGVFIATEPRQFTARQPKRSTPLAQAPVAALTSACALKAHPSPSRPAETPLLRSYSSTPACTRPALRRWAESLQPPIRIDMRQHPGPRFSTTGK